MELNQTEEPRVEEPRVELLFRNGTLTVMGIMLAFSLSFLTQWANNPIAWGLIDLPTIGLISGGILVQLVSLIRLLQHDSTIRASFDLATRIFVVGVALTTTGVIAAIVIDFVQLLD